MKNTVLTDAEIGKDITKYFIVCHLADDFGDIIDCDAQAQVLHSPYFTNQYPRATNDSPAMRLAAT